MSETISVNLTPNVLEVMPGQEVQASVEVENRGHILDVYSIEVYGLGSSWIQLSERSFSVFPGDTATALLSFRPPGVNSTTAMTYEFTVAITSQYFPGEQVSKTGQLTVEPIYSFFHELRPSRVTGKEGRFTNTISNTGNAALNFAFHGDTPDGLCEFLVEPLPIMVPPQQSLEVQVRAKPTRRRWVGKNKTHNITFTITPEQTPQVATLAATLESLPRLRFWHFLLAALLLLLLLVLAYTGYWAAVEREDLTYLRQEIWPAQLETFGAAQGVVFPVLFYISPIEGVEEVEPLPLHLRARVQWPDTGDVPLSLALIIRDPHGNCWEHRHLARSAGLTQFPLFSGGTPCDSIEFDRMLLDHSDRPAKPSTYAPLNVVVPSAVADHGHVHIEPVDQYCVREDSSVIFDGKNPRLAVAHGLSSDEQIDYWTLYVINNNDQQEYEEAPQVTVSLKASVLDKGSTVRDRNYELQVIAVPQAGTPVAASNASTCDIEWDNNASVGTDGKLIEGVIYVKSLEFCDRSEPVCSPETQVTEYVREGESELHILAGHADPCLQSSLPNLDETEQQRPVPAMVCGDVFWEKGQDDTGTSAFVILRDTRGNCWTSLEGQTIAEEDQATPFAFELDTAQPCEEVLRDEVLWYLVSWFPTDSDFPLAAAYDRPVQPLVRLCRSDRGTGEATLMFDTATVIPEVDPQSYPTTTDAWHLFVINGSISAADVSAEHEFAPRVSLHIKSDQHWRATLKDPTHDEPELSSPVTTCILASEESSSG